MTATQYAAAIIRGAERRLDYWADLAERDWFAKNRAMRIGVPVDRCPICQGYGTLKVLLEAPLTSAMFISDEEALESAWYRIQMRRCWGCNGTRFLWKQRDSLRVGKYP